MTNDTRRARSGEHIPWLLSVIADPGDECILFPWQPSQTHPKLMYEGRFQSVGLVTLELSGSPRPPGLQACHDPDICNNGRCVNPRHLRWGTAADNAADRLIAGTNACGERDGNAKLTEADVTEVKRLLSEGWTQIEIGERFGVHRRTIGRIKLGQSWAHFN